MIVVYELNDTAPLAELYVWSYLRTCQQYNTIAEAIGIDTIRVLYRAERRQLIGEIVRQLMHAQKITNYIENWALTISAEHREKFIADVKLDLQELAPFNIAGMNISQQQLKEWLALANVV